MKIYNQKTFAAGLLMIVLGLANLALDLGSGFDGKGTLIIVVLLFWGIGSILRSLSPKFSRQDKLEESDERNRFIDQKAKSQAFRLTQAFTFVLMIVSLICAKLTGYEGFIGIGLGLAFAAMFSMLAEVFAYFYYEKRN